MVSQLTDEAQLDNPEADDTWKYRQGDNWCQNSFGNMDSDPWARGQGQNYSLQVGHQKEYTIQGPGFGDSVLAILWNKDFNSLHMQTFEQVRLFSI